MTGILIGVYGASGFGKEVIPLVSLQTKEMFSKNYEIVFIDDNTDKETLNGYPIWSYESFLARSSDSKYVVHAIANSLIREKLATKCTKDGIKPLSIKAKNVVILDNNSIGEGSLLCAYSMVTSSATIGKYFHANIYSYVAHDCVIGDYVTFAPAVKCNGNIVIEDHAYIGTSAILKQGTPDKPLVIGKGAIIGMGAVVTKDVPPNTTVIGNPAKPLIKN